MHKTIHFSRRHLSMHSPTHNPHFKNLFSQQTTHQIKSCSPIANAILPMRITETFYTHPFKIINRVDRERHASAHHKHTQSTFVRTMAIPICA
ncbi:hypothetical protein Zm00014a_014030 [Zea mays]|uniref:Uncharacterized protein n=1 Tax=Zea mays TaxID=4577 RepID=A0A3L6E565_MAIZE|nr:hypothetical protein Zm00014a_014030 [Zea mays]